MDSSFDISFDATALLDDHQLDTTDILGDNEDFLAPSPVKKTPETTSKQPSQRLSSISLPDLPCLFQSPSNELFSVTHHLRQKESLKNDKIHKLLSSLQAENEDFELDDQLRSRVFRPRTNESYNSAPLDPFDLHLDAFLSTSDFPNSRRHSSSPLRKGADKENGYMNSPVKNANKENSGHVLEPSKRKLRDNLKRSQIKKSRSHASIPLLQSTSNSQNYTVPPLALRERSPSPKRICVPNTAVAPEKSNLKVRQNLRIFLIDSSTKSLDDATSFGTELNSSNCEGFPLPETVNEVVQIPTNEKGGSPVQPQKVAIIRASAGKRHVTSRPGSMSRARVGFYSKREFDGKNVKSFRDVTVFQESQKHVRWADELEW